MKEAPFDVGDELLLTVMFTDESNVAADPQTVTLELICPDTTTESFSGAMLEHPEVGTFSYRYTVANGPGWYRLTARGTGGINIVRQESFPVQEPQAAEAAESGVW